MNFFRFSLSPFFILTNRPYERKSQARSKFKISFMPDRWLAVSRHSSSKSTNTLSHFCLYKYSFFFVYFLLIISLVRSYDISRLGHSLILRRSISFMYAFILYPDFDGFHDAHLLPSFLTTRRSNSSPFQLRFSICYFRIPEHVRARESCPSNGDDNNAAGGGDPSSSSRPF